MTDAFGTFGSKKGIVGITSKATDITGVGAISGDGSSFVMGAEHQHDNYGNSYDNSGGNNPFDSINIFVGQP